MEDRCFVCRKRLRFGEDYTSINKGTHSPSGDKDWVALVFHDACWAKLGEGASKKLMPLFRAESSITW